MRSVVFVISLLLFVNIASAASVDFKDNGSYLTDNVSGLEWLDVSASTYLSYNDVSSQMGAGQRFDGWRYASLEQLDDLVFNYSGSNVSGVSAILLGNGALDGLIDMLGYAWLYSALFTEKSWPRYIYNRRDIGRL